MSPALAVQDNANSLMEFRCHRCWQPNYTHVQSAGHTVECASCYQQIVVPEATQDRIARAVAASIDVVSPGSSSRSSAKQISLESIVDRSDELPLKYLPPANYTGFPPAPLLTRSLAYLIDGVLLVASMVVGFFMLKASCDASQMPLPDEASDLGTMQWVALLAPILLVQLVQWVMITIRGQSLGKLCFFLRIVTLSGELPGFVQGVILRDWLCQIIGKFVPFFGLIDCLFVFSESGRTVHDRISGTRVISHL